MKKRSENCWLMHSRMVAAVAITSAQRHAPRNVRTRVTSASCILPAPACGSSNSIRLCRRGRRYRSQKLTSFHPEMVFAFERERSGRRYYSNPFGMLAFVSAAARAFIQPSRNALSSDGGLDLP